MSHPFGLHQLIYENFSMTTLADKSNRQFTSNESEYSSPFFRYQLLFQKTLCKTLLEFHVILIGAFCGKIKR